MRFLFLLIYALLLGFGAYATPVCRIQRFDENDGLAQWHVTQMTQDRQGMMWFSTWNGLCCYDGYEFQGFKGHVGDGSQIATDRIRSVWLCSDGNLGCRVDEDFYLFSLRSYRFVPDANVQRRGANAVAVKDDRPYNYRDRMGTLWTVYSDGRLTFRERGKKGETLYSGVKSLESARFCMPDIQGNLWVAATSCIYRIAFPEQRGTVVRSASLAETKAFFIDRHNRYWVATKEDNSIAVYSAGNKLVGYLSPTGTLVSHYVKFACPVYCISQCHDGTVWLGSKPGGLYRLTEKDGGKAYRVEHVGGLVCNDVYDIKEDRWGRLWVATLGGGLCCVENPGAERPRVLLPGRELKYYPQSLARKVRMVHIMKNDVLLAATTDGLLAVQLRGGGGMASSQFRLHTREARRTDALSCSATMNVAEDAGGRIFVSTESGGVNMITDRHLTAERLHFRHFGKAEGLPTDVALSVMPYGKRLLVVSSNSIIIFNPDKPRECEVFGKSFFLSECRFSEALPVRLPDGRWIFGLQDGLFSVSPQQLHKSGFIPKLALTKLRVQGRQGDGSINAADTIVLNTEERSLTLSFAALDYLSPADIRYAFALVKGEGDAADVVWNQIGHDHSATLLDLEPGEYRMLIRSTNSDGIWVDNTRTLTIIVTPAFRETVLARILLLLLIVAAVGGAVYTFIYIRRIDRQRREVLKAYLSLLNTGGGDGVESPQTKSPQLSDEDDAIMRRVSAFVEQHLGDADVNVGDMAEAAMLSRSGLQRKMKQIAGVTPLDFLREARMKHACHLLSTTRMNVGEVAFACGFSDPKYFSRCFKSSTGKSPTEWRG